MQRVASAISKTLSTSTARRAYHIRATGWQLGHLLPAASQLRSRCPLAPYKTWAPKESLHTTAAQCQATVLPDRTAYEVVDLQLTTPEGSKQTVRLHAIWLRDHCRCPECWHPITKQRLLDTCTIPVNLTASKVTTSADGKVQIEWNDGHKSVYESAWLQEHAYGTVARPKDHLEPKFKSVLWRGQDMMKDPPTVQYSEIMDSDQGVAKWLVNIAVYGFSLVKGVPPTPEKTKELAERVAFIRETHYGGFWDFTSNLAHGDTAYTTLALGAHTDTTYFTDPIGLQMFHLLEFKGKGGQSLLVDGFKAAEELKRTAPDAYETLSRVRVAAHCAGDEGTYIYPNPRRHSLLVHDDDGALMQVRYNNNDRSTLSHLAFDEVSQYYAALQKWQAIVQGKDMEWWYPLEPGTALLFDNWRVLHGRAAFSGHRRLAGCYINGDDWRSRLRTLQNDPRSLC